MGRLRQLPPRLKAAPTRAKAIEHAPRYGKGRGGRPWRRKRERILKRDQYLCQSCKKQDRLTLATQVDHVVPQFEGGSDEDENLQGICDDCHEAKTQAEARRARMARA